MGDRWWDDLQESRGRRARSKRAQERRRDPEIQERAEWQAAGWVDYDIWRHSWQQDDNGEWSWVDQNVELTPSVGSQRWRRQKELEAELKQKQENMAKVAAQLAQQQQQFYSVQNQTVQATAVVQADQIMREHNLRSAEQWLQAAAATQQVQLQQHAAYVSAAAQAFQPVPGQAAHPQTAASSSQSASW